MRFQNLKLRKCNNINKKNCNKGILQQSMSKFQNKSYEYISLTLSRLFLLSTLYEYPSIFGSCYTYIFILFFKHIKIFNN